MQWLFGRVLLKQMHQYVPEGEWKKDFSSATLILAPIKICHGRKLEATVWFLAYSRGMMLPNAPTMMVCDGTKDSSTSSLKFFSRKFKMKKKGFESKMKF